MVRGGLSKIESKGETHNRAIVFRKIRARPTAHTRRAPALPSIHPPVFFHTHTPTPMGAPASDASLAARVAAASAAHPKPPAFTPAYGTAGFRATASLLPSTLFRCGLLMAARSAALGGATVGVCVTASHNPPADNGVKLVDPSGHMLTSEWEVREWRGKGGGKPDSLQIAQS